jgi:peptidoglycan/LPS O-acetylase OafA/YrhL
LDATTVSEATTAPETTTARPSTDQTEPAAPSEPSHAAKPGREPGSGPTAAERPEVTFGYTPGLDGLRALGLLTILAYHNGFSWARGGIFTLSMFFTLSGFLIASLTLAEWSKHGRMSMKRFWERRARRLLPAAFVTLAVIVLLQKRYALGANPHFKGDVLSALGYVANWRYALNGSNYAAIFLTQQPVQHFWSLAVEEQFYLLFPLLFVGLMAATRGRWKLVGAAFGVLSALSFAAAWIISSGPEGNGGYAYYATHTRASEILVGVTLAFVLVAPPVRRFVASPRGIKIIRWAAVGGALGYVWLWHSIGLDNSLVFHGGTMLNAAFTVPLILACCSATPGRLARTLSIWPLRSLGKVSYAVYLFHWPLFLYLNEDRAGVSGWGLFAYRVGATVGLAIISYFVIEAPFRFRFKLSGVRLAGVLAIPLAALLGLVAVVDVHRAATIDLSQAAAADPYKGGVISPIVPKGAPAPTKILLVGDSVSWTMWPGMNTWNHNHPDQLVYVDSLTAMGCPIAKPGPVMELGKVRYPFSNCLDFRRRLNDAIQWNQYAAVIVAWGGADLGGRKIDGRWQHFGDPAYDKWFKGELDDVGALLAKEKVPVLWSLMPPVHMTPFDDPTKTWKDFPDNDMARIDRLNQLFESELMRRPGFYPVDVASWLAKSPGGIFDPKMRGDGVHYNWAGSDAVSEWLLPRLLQLVKTNPHAKHPGTRIAG